ncbi:MAG: LEA type 2 family protein [Deltaproteobacteria bacterium]|nr:LEA type 2 family protein [Deltaproteobacteria bacterium]
MILSRTFCSLFAIGSLLGCSSTQKNQGEADTLLVEVDRILPEAESLDASAVEVTLLLANPTDSAIDIEGVTYRIDTQDVAGLLEGTVEAEARIEAGQRSELKFKQSVPFPSDQAAYEAILKRQTIPVDLKGEVELSNGSTIEFARAGEVATPSLPRAEVSDPQAARYGSDGVDVTLYLRVINDNVFPILLQNVQYTVYVDDKKVRSETASMGQRMVPSSAEEYEISKTITPTGTEFSAQDLKKILEGGSLTYKIEGEIAIARLTVPFEHSGTITLATGE